MKLNAKSATGGGHQGEMLGILYIHKNHSNDGMVSQWRLAIPWIHLARNCHLIVRTLMDGAMKGSGNGTLESFRIA